MVLVPQAGSIPGNAGSRAVQWRFMDMVKKALAKVLASRNLPASSPPSSIVLCTEETAFCSHSGLLLDCTFRTNGGLAIRTACQNLLARSRDTQPPPPPCHRTCT